MQRFFLNLLSLLLILAGVAAAAYGGWRYYEERGFLSRSETAQATVVGNHLRVVSSGKVEFCPEVRFTTRDGQAINFAGSELDCAYHVKYEKGQEVEVHYDPSEPTHAQVGSFAAKSGDLVAGAVLFALLSGVGLLVRLPLRQRRTSVDALS